MTVVPVNVPAKHKAEYDASKNAWKTPTGWIYPGKKTMRESNIHPMKPNLARLDQLEDVSDARVWSLNVAIFQWFSARKT